MRRKSVEYSIVHLSNTNHLAHIPVHFTCPLISITTFIHFSHIGSLILTITPTHPFQPHPSLHNRLLPTHPHLLATASLLVDQKQSCIILILIIHLLCSVHQYRTRPLRGRASLQGYLDNYILVLSSPVPPSPALPSPLTPTCTKSKITSFFG